MPFLDLCNFLHKLLLGPFASSSESGGRSQAYVQVRCSCRKNSYDAGMFTKAATAIVLVVLALFIAADVSAAIPLGGSLDDDRVSLVYDPSTGGLSLDAAAYRFWTVEISSESGYFTGARPEVLVSAADNFVPSKLFTLQPTGVGDTDFGPALAPGIAAPVLADDLAMFGDCFPVDCLSRGVDLIYVPEPSSFALLPTGVMLVALRRRR